MEGLLKELHRREVPLYLANTPHGYRYDPETGKLLGDAQAVAAASLLEWRPHDYITLPREQHH